MTDLYEKAAHVLEEVAQSEKKPELSVSVTLPIGVVLSVYCHLYIAIKEMEERILNDLRRDHKLPTPRERLEIKMLLKANESFIAALKSTE